MRAELARQSEFPTRLAREIQFSRYKRLLIAVFLFMTALSIRLYQVNEPPLNFHATRQYRSFIIARGFYYENSDAIPEWKKQVASSSQQRQDILEPPLVEFVVSIIYRLVGGEHFWIPRLVSSIFWLTGGAFLYLIARRMADPLAAMFSTVFYLFLPFAVIASRSFQPDPLIIMMLLMSIFAILRYYDHSSALTWVIAATTAALTFLIKPISLFTVMGVFVSLAIYRQGVRRAVLNPSFLKFTGMSLWPTVIFYWYGIFIGGFLRDQAQASFLPHLLLDPFFWKNWLINIGLVVGFIPFIGALLGIALVQEKLSRALLIGLWIGYGVFCLVFAYHTATHDYYHLQLIPIVALSLAPLFALVMNQLKQVCLGWRCRVAVACILFLAFFLSLALARARLINSDFERKKAIVAAEIGAQVHHSTQTVYLDPDYGLPLEYHGELSGQPWPLGADLEWERLAGVRVPKAEERFEAEFAKSSPEYFIVMDRQEFEEQADLRSFLTEKFPIVAQNDDYLIFDLRRRADLDRQSPASAATELRKGEVR